MTSFDLSNRAAVVTGALGKIGRAIALGLHNSGARVIGLDRPGMDGGAVPFDVRAADVSDASAVGEIVEALAGSDGGFDIWVNAAYPRTDDWGRNIGREDAASWVANVTMQMTATCVAADAAARAMADGHGGSLINVASIYGMVSPDFSIYEGTAMGVPGPYSAIKGGLINHTRYLAGLYGAQGVRANVLAPGGVAAGQDRSFVDAYSKRTALKRLASAEDMVGPAVFLASDASAYVTGVCLPVDGGWTAI